MAYRAAPLYRMLISRTLGQGFSLPPSTIDRMTRVKIKSNTKIKGNTLGLCPQPDLRGI